MQNTIAIVFDFDDTLAPDSTSGFLRTAGIEPGAFWQKTAELYEEGWDPVPAYLYLLLHESQRRKAADRIKGSDFEAWGQKLGFFNGVPTIFNRLSQFAAGVNPLCRVEFYLVSSGIGSILRHTRVARYFTDIWACDYHYNRRGEIEFPKNIVSFTDKTRYLFQVQKGLIGPEYHSRPFEVNRVFAPDELHVPFEHMIFVGDGYTDIPCFSLVRRQGGIAFGVYDPDNTNNWRRAWGYVEDGRISNLAPADFGKRSSLTHSLLMAVNKIASNMILAESSYRG
jgi:hypothetical protein